MSRPKAWSPADDAYLRGHYPTQPTAAIADHLGHPQRHVQQRAHYLLGIKKAPGAKTLRTDRWTQLDDLLQLLYADMHTASSVSWLSRSYRPKPISNYITPSIQLECLTPQQKALAHV